MSTLARFESDRLTLMPGEQATWSLTVTNASPIVEAYRFEPKGDLAAYASVEPALLSLYPGTDGTATVTLDLPRTGDVLAGELPFAVLVEPQEDPDNPAVPEGTVTVAPFLETDYELSPRTVPARRWTRHSLAVDNRGNHPVLVDLIGEDTDGALRVTANPRTLRVEPGQAAFSKVRTRSVRILWRGQPRTLPFHVLPITTLAGAGEPDLDATAEHGAPQVPVPGQVVQQPVFPRGTGKVLGLAAAAVAALAVLWFALLRPVVRSEAQDAARQAVAQQLAGVTRTANTAAQQAQQAGKQSQQAGEQAKVATQQATLAGAQAKRATDAAGGGSTMSFAAQQAAGIRPFGRRLITSTGPGGSVTEQYTVPDKMVLSVTDLVFQSQGDFGNVQLMRDDLPLITVQTQDYRTLDQHFVSPIIFTAGQRVADQLSCRTPQEPNLLCQSAIYVSGTLQPEVAPTPSSTPQQPGQPSSPAPSEPVLPAFPVGPTRSGTPEPPG